MRRTMTHLALVLCLVGAATVQAQDALDRATIERWMAAMGELQTWSEGIDDDTLDLHDEDMVDAEGMPDFQQMERAYRELINHHGEAGAIISRHGFRDAGQWANVSSRIIQALMAIEMQAMQPEMDAQMAEAMRQLEANPNIPPEQREMMRQQMQQAMGSMGRMTEGARAEDVPAVEAMRPQLRTFLDMDF